MRHFLVTLIVVCGLVIATTAQQSTPSTSGQSQSQTPNAEKHAAGPEAPKPETPTVAVIEPQISPDLEASVAEPLIPEPDTTASIAAPDQGIDPAPAAVPTPTAKPKPATATAKSAPKAVAKIVRKKRVRTAQHAAPANNSLGTNAASNPFGIPRQ